MNTKCFNVLIINLMLYNYCFSQIPVWPLANTWDQINCTFSELHGSNATHIHGAIDINCSANDDPAQGPITSTQFMAILDGEVLTDASGQTLFFVNGHDFQNPLNNTSNLKQVRYGDQTDPLSQITNGTVVTSGQAIGEVTDGGHLHYEMWIRDCVGSAVDCPWRRVDPLNNPEPNYLNLPPNYADNTAPEINDLILQPLNEPTGINSGYLIQNGPGLFQFSNNTDVRIHILDRPNIGGTLNSQHPLNGAVYNQNNSDLIVFGSMGSILHLRDPEVTNGINASGGGLGVYGARFMINQIEKYRMVFDGILTTELNNIEDFYHIQYNGLYAQYSSQSLNQAFGNDDYLEMRRTVAENETARRPHKLINYDPDLQNPNNPIQQIQSNGIWATKARNTTLPVFPTTPVDIARAPCEALYNDGNHTLDFEVTDAANNSNTAQVVAIVDNFKPYIAHVQMLINNQIIYDSQWDCETCGGIAYHNTLLQSINAANFQQYGMVVKAYPSEPMATMILNIPLFGLTNMTPSAPTNDGTVFIFNIAGSSVSVPNADRSLHFVGNDLAGNNLMNLETFKNNPCVSMPARTSATAWTNPAAIPYGADDTHEVPQICPVITPVAVVTTPSSCIINDGFIHLLQINGEGSQGTDIEWWDMQTSTELVPAYGSISNLAPGIYRLSITDLESGCISQTFYDLNTPSTQINTDVYSSPTCVGASVGAIEVDAYTLDYSGGSYDFAWSNGEITTDDIISEINGLAAGIYTVTVSSPETGCTTMTSVEVVAIAPSATLSVTGTSLNACPGLANGVVTLQVTGGISPYTYHWSSTSYGSHPNNLAPGTHTVTVTDYCGSSVTMTFNITQMDYVIFDIPGCAHEGTLSIINYNAGNFPYHYNWEDGSTSLSISNLASGLYQVTVSDARGCELVKSEWLLNKEFELIETNIPCEGTNDGTAMLYLNNPLLDPFQVLLDGVQLYLPWANQVQEEIPGLTGGVLHTLDISIGQCHYEYPFILETEDIDHVFSHGDIDFCYYDAYCDGVQLAEDAYTTPTEFDFYNAQGDWAHLCRVPKTCEGGEQVGWEYYTPQLMRVAEYYTLLNIAAQNGIIDLPTAQAFSSGIGIFGLTPCSYINVCPVSFEAWPDLGIVGIVTELNQVTGEESLGNNCWHYDCSLPFSDFTFCADNLTPDYITEPVPDPETLCLPRQYNVYQLLVWYGSLLLENGFQGSTLQDFLLENMNDERAKCASVVFCRNSFEYISDNLNQIDCTSDEVTYYDCPDYAYNYPDVECVTVQETVTPCEVLYADASSERILCRKGAFQSTVGSIFGQNSPFYLEYINYTFNPATFLMGSGGEEPTFENDAVVDCQFVDPSDDFFDKFTFTKKGDVIVPNAFVQSGDVHKFYDYELFNKGKVVEEIPNYIQYVEDQDIGQRVFIEKLSGNNQYMLHSIRDNTEWTKTLSANTALSIDWLDVKGGFVYIGGTFNGNIAYAASTVATSAGTTPADFVIKVNDINGNFHKAHVISKTDVLSDMKYEVIDGELVMTDRGKQSNIIIDGQSITLDENGKTFTAKFDGQEVTIESIIKSTGTVKLLDMARSADGQRITYLYKGQGSVKVNNTTVVTTTVDRLILLTTSADDQYLWVRTIDSPLTNDAPAGLTYGDDYQVYTGLTHNSGISISGNPIDNNGGYDIFLLRFDENGDLTGNKVYGTSQEDENVKQLFYNSGILYFGGEFMGPTEERIIGKYRFLNLAGNNSNAYISFVKNESFDDTPVQPLVSAGNSGSNPMHPEFGYDGKNKEQVTTVNIFPSPFSDYLMIDFNIAQKSYFNMELYNTIGELIVRKGIELDAGKRNVSFQNLDNLPSGVYILEVTDADGRKWVFKTIKS